MSLRLSVRELEKSYKGASVLKGASFSFEHRGVYAVMGDNGSGKSTLLRICALLEAPDKGSVEYSEGGGVLSNDIIIRRRFTLMLPKVGVFNTSVFNNVAYGLKIRGMGKDEVKKKAGSALDFVGLNHKQDQNGLTLSSGETQRLGIARAMVINPEILFLDEPTAFVDTKNKAIIEDIIKKLNKDHKCAVIMTTHDRHQAERLADRLLMIEDGLIIE